MKSYEGVIVKGIGGFYYVNTDVGVIECRARGIFRKRGFAPLVGDVAKVSTQDGELTGVIESVAERKNSLIRPAVANVTQMVVVVALESPKPNLYVLDKLIAAAEYARLKITICFNKSDLTGNYELVETYKKSGFHVILTSAEENLNTGELTGVLKNEVTVFAGNSGVGKSSLLNRIMGEKMFETGSVSDKTERGRHTTRHSELVKLPFGGYIIDTPGFSSFELDSISVDELPEMFREFRNYTENCRFLDCCHLSEPDCGVSKAVKDKKIPASRYESYKILFDEIKTKAIF